MEKNFYVVISVQKHDVFLFDPSRQFAGSFVVDKFSNLSCGATVWLRILFRHGEPMADGPITV